MQKTYLSLPTIDASNNFFILHNKVTAPSQYIYKQVTLKIPLSNVFNFMASGTGLSTVKWKENQSKSALQNLCLSNASYSQGETTKDSFISLSLSH
jgi:hypothetical protein